jgi:hypothetical protein
VSEFGYHDIERSALAFVLEDESWPVFLAWFRQNHTSVESHDWLESGPDLEAIRRDYMLHSPDPRIRSLAGAP